jgi:hypothetical protein
MATWVAETCKRLLYIKIISLVCILLVLFIIIIIIIIIIRGAIFENTATFILC